MVTSPSFSCGTMLSAKEIRDEIRNRHGLKVLSTSPFCDGRGGEFSDMYALALKVGGLAHSRHDEDRYFIGFLACASF